MINLSGPKLSKSIHIVYQKEQKNTFLMVFIDVWHQFLPFFMIFYYLCTL